MSKPTDLSTALTARLRYHYTKEQIAGLTDSVAELHDMGFKFDDIFPDGILNPDALVLKTSVPMAGLEAAIMKIQKHPELRRIEIFPYGIPVRDLWRMHVKVGLK
ncbi:hypothetical protein F2P44_25765 [Massilia sp. CCM 8695]|uniref:Uncharacterized protein n=1 Tax=Massilia frigida TaxID=2609281 RepID=A0ABX0NC03_9BURK|nr:hypothetical protein [Massilia frigida]NHZ82659.1 hypothetical protein [Massilia frigida]